MKKYCTCGYGNEYSTTIPEKCEKCGKNFDLAFSVAPAATPKPKEELDDYQHFEDSKFDEILETPEPINQNEIEQIFLANANRGINLKDLIKSNPTQSNKKVRRPRQSSRKKK